MHVKVEIVNCTGKKNISVMKIIQSLCMGFVRIYGVPSGHSPVRVRWRDFLHVKGTYIKRTCVSVLDNDTRPVGRSNLLHS